MRTRNPQVEAFLDRATRWRNEMRKLRRVLLDCGLDEDLKWGKPCFHSEGEPVATRQPFKALCSLTFFKGALLRDPHGLRRSQGENTQSARRLEFTTKADIDARVLNS
jgi:uncharacterized protein YdeI (YjbR/CyaY-like superfamily)